MSLSCFALFIFCLLTNCSCYSHVTPVQFSCHIMFCPFIGYFEGSRMYTVKDMRKFVNDDSLDQWLNTNRMERLSCLSHLIQNCIICFSRDDDSLKLGNVGRIRQNKCQILYNVCMCFWSLYLDEISSSRSVD